MCFDMIFFTVCFGLLLKDRRGAVVGWRDSGSRAARKAGSRNSSEAFHNRKLRYPGKLSEANYYSGSA